MKKLFAILLSLALVLSLSVTAAADTKSQDIVILYTNDVHTYLDGSLSYDVLAAVKEDLQRRYAHVLLVDAGDHIQGTAYGSMDQGKTVITLMNQAGYDLATLGNHELDYSMEGCLRVIREWAEFPYVSCNFYHMQKGVRSENLLESYRLFDCGKLTLAFVGITTPETLDKAATKYVQNEAGEYIYGISGGEDGSEMQADVQRAIDEARAAGADLVIGLGHLGVDLSSEPWTSPTTIAGVSGMNAFIDGHSHTLMEGELVADKEGKDVLLTQTGEYFGRIGMMVIDAETGAITTDMIECSEILGDDGQTLEGYSLQSDLYPDLAYRQNQTVQATKDAWIGQLDAQLNQPVGTMEVTLDNFDGETRLVRIQETNSGDFCADAVYYLFDSMDMDVDLAIVNSGGIRNKAITGPVSYLSFKNMQPFGNVACMLNVTGQQILDALEWGSRMAGTGESCGGFLQVSGLTYHVDTTIPSTVQGDVNDNWLSGPTGEYRVHDVKLYNRETGSWEDLKLDGNYKIAGYNYNLRDFGDGFTMFEGAENVLDYVMEDYLVLANYVEGFENAVITADNSPLNSKYPGFGAEYTSLHGAGRILLEDTPHEIPAPTEPAATEPAPTEPEVTEPAATEPAPQQNEAEETGIWITAGVSVLLLMGMALYLKKKEQ